MKKWVKKLIVVLGILLVVILLANFGLNIWLKTQLPNYIKNNTDYKVSYKSLDVDLMSGNILSIGITVNNKNPQNSNVMGLQGTVDTLKISRFGIYDAIFNKQISSSDLLLSKPTLNIILAKPVDTKTGKKRNPVRFENIRINEGNISIFRYTKQKFFSVQDLNLYVENLQMTEESVEDKLPVVFDKYDIRGKNFFVRPDNVYALKIKEIKTSDGQMSIDQFQLIPLLSFDLFKKYYPKKTKLFRFNIQKMEFTDIVLKKNKVSLANASFYNPDLLVYITNAAPIKAKKKKLNFELNLDDIKLNNATVQVMKPDGRKLLYARKLNLNINQLKFDKETKEEIIPVGYKDFQLSGQDILYSNHQDFSIRNILLNPKKGELRIISVAPNGLSQGKTSMDLVANYIGFNINKWELVDKKLNLDVKDVLVDRVKGSIKAGEVQAVKKTANLSGIQFPILIRKVALKNSDITYEKNNQPLSFNNLNAIINDIQLTSKTGNSGIAVDMKNYILTSNSFAYKTKFYKMTSGLLKIDKNNIKVAQFAMKPLVSRAQFIKMIPVERDLYDIKVNQITANGNWDLFSQNKSVNASNVTVQSADANISEVKFRMMILKKSFCIRHCFVP
ncbi:hypothetical protein ACFOEQ_18025 [Chryseobacterium arachidis]|uniref:hypothetical protein n=1 Tax=Chryseobacterium arachidis TaxID=1416778 RepID=UPI0036139F9A